MAQGSQGGCRHHDITDPRGQKDSNPLLLAQAKVSWFSAAMIVFKAVNQQETLGHFGVIRTNEFWTLHASYAACYSLTASPLRAADWKQASRICCVLSVHVGH